MKAILIYLLLSADPTPAAAPTAVAPQPASKAVGAASMDTNADKKVDATETATAVDSDATVGDVVKDTAVVVKDATALKADIETAKQSGDRMAIVMVISTFLAGIFKLLLSLLKVLGKNVAWFQGKDGKRVVKYSTLALGALAGLAANIGFGVPLVECFLIAGSGPLAVAIHEYTKDSKEVAQEPAPAQEAKSG